MRLPPIINSTVMLIGILLVALLLRLLMLGHQSLWLDEFASWMFASRDLKHVLNSEPTNPPLYYLLLHFWMRWFGTSEFAIRSMSVVPSLFSVGLIYFFAQRLFTRQIAYLAAAYQAVSTFQIYYAQEGRCFALLVSILLLATFALWNALESQSTRQKALYYCAYALLGAVALYTHFISLFFLAAHGLYVLIRRPRQLLAVAGSIAASMLLFSPWLLTMLRAASGGGQVRRYIWLKLPQAYFSFLYGDSLIPLDEEAVQHIQQTLQANWWILAAALLSMAALAPFMISAWRRWGEPMLFVFTMASVPVLLAWGVSFKVMLFDERYLIPASPFLYVVISAAVWEIYLLSASRAWSRSLVNAGRAACGIYAVLLGLALYHYYFNPRFAKEQWREADAYIDSLSVAGQSTLIVFEPDYLLPCYQYYTKRNLARWQLTPQVEAKVAELLKEQTRGYQQIVLVRSHAAENTAANVMRGAFTEESYRKFAKANPIEVYSFRTSPK